MSFVDKVTGKEMTQLELPGMPPRKAHVAFSGKASEGRWFYISEPRGRLMLVLDEKGRPIWIPHDTVRNTPHLFNTWQGAKMFCRDNNIVVDVRRYEWQKR